MSLSLALFSSPLNTPAGQTGQVTSLALASGRKLVFDVAHAATLSFSLPGRHWTTALVQVGISDVMAWWSDSTAPLQRFRVTSSQIQSDTSGNINVTFTCSSYRLLAESWIFHDTDTRSWTGIAQTDLMWNIFNGGQTKSAANLGVVQGLRCTTDTVRDRPASTSTATPPVTTEYYPAGKTRLQALTELEAVIGGPEWDIRPSPTVLSQLTLDCWTQRGTTDPTVPLPLIAGSTVAAYTRQVDFTSYANVVREQGASAQGATTAAPVAYSPSTGNPTGTPPEGRWERAVSSAAIVAVGVQEDADGELARDIQPLPTWALTLQQGYWRGPSDLWLGDVTRLLVQVTVDDPQPGSEYLLNVDLNVRVLRVDITLDEGGGEIVTIAVGRAPITYNLFRQNLERRLALLELAGAVKR